MTLARATDNVDAVSIMFFLFMEELVVLWDSKGVINW
jgi:hypothetical protein